MSTVKKILFVLFSVVLVAVIAASILNLFMAYDSGWDAIGGTLGWLFFGGIIGLVLSIFSLQKLSQKQFNQAFLLSLIGIIILLGWILFKGIYS